MKFSLKFATDINQQLTKRHFWLAGKIEDQRMLVNISYETFKIIKDYTGNDKNMRIF